MGNNYLKTRLSQPEVIQRITVDLKYGGNSKVYFNIKNVLGDPEIRNKLSDQLYKLFPENITCVYGEGFGGRPLAEAISSRHFLKYTTLRKEKKGYGPETKWEYHKPTKEDRVAIVDDVLSTGRSLKDSIKSLESITNISGCYVVVDREDVKKISEYSGDEICGYPFGYLFKSRDLL